MEEMEIRAKFNARKCESQLEFDRLMNEMNTEQEHLNHPLLDRKRALEREKQQLLTQREALGIQLNQNKLMRIELEQQQKNINRMFHDLKHQLIITNPRELFANDKRREAEGD